MQVNGSGSVSGTSPVGRTQPISEVHKPESAKSLSPRDEVTISKASQMFDRLSQSSEVRAERLARIKAEIDAETYDTPEKMEAALSKLFGEVGLNFDDES